jgi:hypothetical protein
LPAAVEGFDDAGMLADAIAQARRLVSDLQRQRAELDVPSSLTSEQLSEGRRAFDDAIVAARRLLDSLEAQSATS